MSLFLSLELQHSPSPPESAITLARIAGIIFMVDALCYACWQDGRRSFAGSTCWELSLASRGLPSWLSSSNDSPFDLRWSLVGSWFSEVSSTATRRLGCDNGSHRSVTSVLGLDPFGGGNSQRVVGGARPRNERQVDVRPLAGRGRLAVAEGSGCWRSPPDSGCCRRKPVRIV